MKLNPKINIDDISSAEIPMKNLCLFLTVELTKTLMLH